jgi:endonuclease/exonuclease/phosphatase family metal-dependent hydrolase
MERVASSDVDHVLIGPELQVLEPARTLDRGVLSDHVPLSVSLELRER